MWKAYLWKEIITAFKEIKITQMQNLGRTIVTSYCGTAMNLRLEISRYFNNLGMSKK